MSKPLLSKLLLPAIFLPLILTIWGCGKAVTPTAPIVVPTVVTNGLISQLTSTTAQSGGIVTSNGGGDITASGVCYSSTNSTPTTADTKTTDTLKLDLANTKSFTSNLTGLTANTVYYVRAYAINSTGAGYGSVVKFTTTNNATPVTATVSTFAGSGQPGYFDAMGTNALFYNPQGVAADAAGNIYVADGFNNRIREIDPTGLVSTFTGNGTPGFTNGNIAVAEFYGPQNVAIDAQGNIYVADVGNDAIRKITTAGVVSTLAGDGLPGYIDGADTVALFNNPQATATDASGNVYVADRTNNLIRKITPAGVVSTLAGYYGYPGYVDNTGLTAEFNGPAGIAVDASGNIYVADTKNYSIRKVTPAGVVTTVAGSTVQTTLVGTPTGLAIDSKGDLFIADETGRILEITADHVLYVLAGKSGAFGYVDGDGASARFNSPQGITVDAAGNIYVADYNNNVIRKITVSIQ